MHVQVAVKRTLPAAERKERERLGDWPTAAGHTRCRPLPELACRAARLREDRRHVAQRHLVGLTDRVREGGRPSERKDGAKDLFMADTHPGCDAIEDGRPEEESRPRHLVPTVDDQLRALRDSLVDIPGDLVAMLGPDEGATWTDGSSPGPTISLVAASLSGSSRVSAARPTATATEPARHRSPALPKAELRTAATARAGSASGMTTMWFLAPPRA